MGVAEEHMTILRQGVAAWNRFMRAHAYEVRAVFREANLAGMDLTEAVMNGADFEGTDLRGAILNGGTFQRANFNRAILTNDLAQSFPANLFVGCAKALPEISHRDSNETAHDKATVSHPCVSYPELRIPYFLSRSRFSFSITAATSE
jgi:uncharacterized protein YjbI with pentapeptide repeats